MYILGSYGRQKKIQKIEFEREKKAKQNRFWSRRKGRRNQRQKQEEKLKKLQDGDE